LSVTCHPLYLQGISTFQDASLAAIVLLGPRLDEPIARRGPFVMNTAAEIEQAFEDFYSGKIARESRTA
jgi:redox-sensitive bicupin YhaK (pirin superfamily)